MSDTPSFLPLTVGDITLVEFAAGAYVDTRGRTYWSGIAEPSQADALDALANPRTPPAPVPDELPAWRIHAIAELAGLTPQIEAAIEALPQPARTYARAAWGGNVLRRDSTTISGLAAALGLTAAQVDDFFLQAASIPNP